MNPLFNSNEELRSAIDKLRNSRRASNWVLADKDYDELTKKLEKMKPVIAKTGLPRMYVKAVSDLDLAVQEAWKTKQSLGKESNRGLTSLKNALKKFNRDNYNLDAVIVEYRKNPDASNAEESEEAEETEESEESDESDDEPVTKKPAPAAKGKAAAKKRSCPILSYHHSHSLNRLFLCFLSQVVIWCCTSDPITRFLYCY